MAKKLVKKQDGGTKDKGRNRNISEDGNYKTIERWNHSRNKDMDYAKTTRTLKGVLRGVPKPNVRGEQPEVIPSTPRSVIAKKGGQIKKKKK